jgi:hypothetical protein
MKSVVVFIFLNLSFLCFSQENLDLESNRLLDSIPRLTGHLSNYQRDYNKDLVVSYTILTPDFKGIKQGVASISDNGDFTINISKPFPHQKVRITIGNLYKGFLIVNSNLHIDVDLNAISSRPDNYFSKAVEFSGADGGITGYYNQYHEYKVDKKEKIKSEKLSTLRSRTSQAEFKVRQLKEHYNEFEKLERAFAKKHGNQFLWILKNERESEYYGDLTSIFIGKPMPKDLWEETMLFKPLVVSEVSNRFYGILAIKLLTHEEKEIRTFSRMIFQAEATSEEEKKEIDLFMIEQDKKKAGVSYDNELYARGIQKYLAKYDEQLANAKLSLYFKKLSTVPSGKRGLVIVKGQPLALVDRSIYIDKSSALIDIAWQSEMMKDEFEIEKLRIEEVTSIMKTTPQDISNPKLGALISETPEGASLWSSDSDNITALLRQVKAFYKDNNVIVYIWNFTCSSCRDDIRRSALNYEEMEGRPLRILTIMKGQDVSQSEWQKLLTESKVKGEHLFLNNQLSAELVEFFQLPSGPAHLFFDQLGNFDPYKVLSIVSIDIMELLSTD